MTNDPRPNAPAMLASGMVLGLILFLVAAIYGSFTIIQPGNVGVVFNRWSGALKTVGQGVAWRVLRDQTVEQRPGFGGRHRPHYRRRRTPAGSYSTSGATSAAWRVPNASISSGVPVPASAGGR